MEYDFMKLQEAKRSELISKSKRGDNYKSRPGENRYKRRMKSKVSTTVRDYNDIDMNKFFKNDMLSLSIKVHGETDDYLVRITFGHILDEIQRQVEQNNGNFEIKCILRSLVKAFNSDDVYISCSCPDFMFRFSFWATKNNYNSGEPENRPADITNPTDSKGAGCKHIMLVLSNTSWVMKLAICIKNYVDFIQKRYEKLYADIIYPRIYGKKYEEPVQLDLDSEDTDELNNDEVQQANDEKRKSTQFQKGNTKGVRFAPKENPNENDQLDIEDIL